MTGDAPANRTRARCARVPQAGQLFSCLFRLQIQSAVPLVELFVFLAPGLVDPAAADNGRTRIDLFGPGLDVLVLVDGEEFRRIVKPAKDKPAIPGEDGDVGDRVVITSNIGTVGEGLVENVEQALLALDLGSSAPLREPLLRQQTGVTPVDEDAGIVYRAKERVWLKR